MKSKALFKPRDVISLIKNRIPGQIVIQYTDRCNAECPQCSMNKTLPYPRHTANMEDVKRTIEAAGEMGFKAISFTGGEPLLYIDEIMELSVYAELAGIEYIRTGTNGYMFMNSQDARFNSRIHSFAEKLRNTKIRNLWISIDSAVPEVHEKMRGLPGVVKGIEKALPIFHQYDIYPSINLGINRNINGLWEEVNHKRLADGEAFYSYFYEGFDGFFRFAKNLGFTIANACYPMSVSKDNDKNLSAVYGADSSNNVVCFDEAEKLNIYRALMDQIPNHRSSMRIFTPTSSLYSLIKDIENGDYSYPCRGGKDFFFVSNKDAEVYPCGYRGNESLGKLWDLNSTKKTVNCRSCDWECFRDPSVLTGPVIEAFNHPIALGQKLVKEKEYFKLWYNDMRYYRDCDYFNGRIAPRPDKLKKYEEML